MITKTSLKLAIVGLAAFCISAQAIQFNLNSVVPGTGPAPSGSAPWLTIDIVNDSTPNWVDITFTPHLSDGEKIGFVLLNFDPSRDPNLITLEGYNAVGVALPLIKTEANKKSLPGDGDFDILFDFANPNPHDPGHKFLFDGDSIAFTFSGPGLTAEMFNFGSEQHGKGNPYFGYLAGAHVQGLTGQPDSTSIVPGPNVPEFASTLMLLGLAFGALTALRRSISQ